METNKTITEKWLIDNRSIYCLHETGRLKKGEPELCNKFYFNVQFDYPRGITEDMATEQVQKIHTAINNYDALVEENRKLKEALDMVTRIFIYSSKGEFKVEDKVKATELAVRVLIGSGITNIGETFEKTTEKEATKDE